MKTIDTRGRLCPMPLIMTKKAIQESLQDEEMVIITDNTTACGNLKDYLRELNYDFTTEENDSEQYIRFTKPAMFESDVDAAQFCSLPSQKRSYVIVLKSCNMGSGDNQLGDILMRAFINSLVEADSLPESIIMYNSGVKLAVKGSDTALSLQKLEDRGVAVFSCGTCLDFYNLKESLAVGVITNMFKITQLTTNASHVVYP